MRNLTRMKWLATRIVNKSHKDEDATKEAAEFKKRSNKNRKSKEFYFNFTAQVQPKDGAGYFWNAEGV